MIHQYRVTRFLFMLLTVICSMHVYAGVEPYQNQLKGTIKKVDTLIVKDEKFRNASFDWNEITNRTVKNFLSLQITHDTPVVLNKAFTAEVDLKVEYYSAPDQAEPITINSVKLKVNFSPDTGGTYKARDVYSFSNGYQVKITVNSITSPELGDDIPPVLQLTSQVVIDRQYVFHPEKPVEFSGTMITNNATAPAKNTKMMALSMAANSIDCYFLHLDWNNLQGAEEFDVEWAIFDQYTAKQPLLDQVLNNQPLAPEVLDGFFRNNATRITTDEHSYDISMVYNAKYIMVRIRQVQYNNGYRDEADWNYQPFGQYAIWEIPCWHEEKLNWQYSATFAEEGKKKEIVSYFDGSLRSRQVVTMNNSDQVAVVQETVYDEFGRAAANIIPAPTLDDKFHFYPNFNRNQGNTATYDYRNLKGTLNSETCENIPEKLGDASGAANYYSDKNAFLALDKDNDTRYRNYNKYIPHANGYPMSVTQFTNDNTGRLRVQGGVGPQFQPGATDRHVTKYYYGKPETWELDRLFGNDIGYANHYQKNMVVDPNGQISVSYINASGKTIATALTGSETPGTDALPSKPDAKPETFTILRPQQFVYDATALSLKAKTTYLSSVPNATASFNYNIQELVYNYQGTSNTGAAFQVCSNCYYDLNIRITNDCGEPVYSTSTPIQIGSKTGNCNYTPQTYQPFSCTFREIGEYFISFDLKLSKAVIEDYTNAYIKQRNDNHSLKTELDFILDYMKSLDYTGCFNECNTCEAALGTEAQFTKAITDKLGEYGYQPAGLTPEVNSFISGLYGSLRSNCLALKASCMVSSCSKYEKEMLDDVSPGGQYALFTYNPFTPLESDINVLVNHFRDVFPVQTAGNALWNTEAFTDENGNTISPYDASFTVEMLVKYWQDAWATKFLQFHPEKCKLDFCNTNSNYIMWDDQVQQFVNKATDIPNIPGNNGATYSYTNSAWLVDIDPFFQTGPGASYRTQFIDDLKNYSTNIMKVTTPGAQTKGITQVIDYLMYCADLDGSTNSSGVLTNSWNNCTPVPSCRVPDREWDQYKDLYFQLKQQYYQTIRNSFCASYCPVGKPYTTPGTCATTNDFGIEKAIGNTACGQGRQAIRITYGKGLATKPMTVDLYYPGEFASLYKINSVQFALGQSEKIICISDTILVSSIKVKGVTCTGITPVTCIAGSITDQLTLTGNVQQLSSTKFQVTTPEGVVTTYTIVPGRADQPPADATYCPDGTLVKKDFSNCFKLFMPNSTVPVQFFNVWVVGCQKNLCVNAPEYTFDFQVAPYKYYLDGKYYYLQLQTGEGATPECATTPEFKPCIRVNVPGNSGQIFLNVNISSCDACPGGMTVWNLGFPLNSDPLVYSDGNGGTIEVFAKTAPNYYPPSSQCGNPIREFYGCLKILSGKLGYITYLNATVLRCPHVDPCDNAPDYGMDGGGGGHYWASTPDYYEQITVFPNSDHNTPIPDPSNYCSGTEVYQDWYDCVKYTANGVTTSYQNAWVVTCFSYYNTAGSKQNIAIDSLLAKSGITVPQHVIRINSHLLQPVPPPNSVAYNYRSPNALQTGKYAAAPYNNMWIATPCPEAYAYKKSRFPDVTVTNLSSQDLTDIQNENNALVSGQIASNCEAQADKWISQLSDCLASYSPGVKDQLRAKLIEVCTNGGDLDHPYGSSTVRTGYTGTGYSSFKEAVRSVLGISALTMTCNPWVIDEPHPFEPKQQSVSKTLSTTNAGLCSRLAQLRSQYSGSDFYGYLKQTYGDAMNLTSTQLDMLLKSCNNCRYILEDDIPEPVFMEPGTVGCITKTDYDAAKAALATELGGNLDVNAVNYPDVLTNFLNQRWGFSMAYFRYQQYESDLQTNPSAILCNNPPYTQVEVDQYVCLKSLVESAIVSGRHDYVAYIEEEKRKFRVNYVNTCSQTQGSAQVTTVQQTYHYTLFYYDQAGNLIRTVSPEGVRPLSEEELLLVDEYRKQGQIVDCSGFNLAATESKPVALNKISTALQGANGKSLELWLNGSGATRQVRFVTPDNKYFYQAAIANNILWVELYTLNPGTNGDIAITLSNQAVADISAIPVQDWSHIVVQQPSDFTGSQWTLYLDNHKLTLLPTTTPPPYPFEWSISAGFTVPADVTDQLRHIRFYDRLINDQEIAADFASQCRAPEGQLAIPNSPLIVWGRFNLPTMCNNTTNTRTVGNRGALQVLGNLNGSQTNSFTSIANTFTVEMWVNPQGTHEIDAESQTGTAGTSGQKYAIYPTQATAASGAAGMGISVGTNGVSVYENADSYMPPLLVWPGSVTGWHHIAVVYNNKVPSLYIDGQFVRAGQASTKATVYPSYNFCSGPYGTMTGGLDEVRIWNIARAQSEINADYRRSIAPATNGLVAYWPMSREDNSDLYDVTCAHIPVHLSSNYVWTTNPTAPVADVVPIDYAVKGIFPRHRLTSSYAFSSSDNLIQIKTPDGGLSYFWYDQLSRLTASQNEEQRTPHNNINPNRYTYTEYDPIGRIQEIGEKSNVQTLPAPGFLSQNDITTFNTTGTKTQITQTVYDKVPIAGNGIQTGLLQENLRKRISASLYKEIETGPVLQASYYSYDLTGNVKTLWQQVEGLDLKRIDYEYDLVVSKPSFIRYQQDKNDQFFYSYKYDANNRLTEAYSGTQALIKPQGGSYLLNGQLDVFYQYYLHGTLARTELGQNKVQGLDYAYTLQGWTKGINGHKLNATDEMGQDGNIIGRDVLAYSLGYFQGDYQPIGGTNTKAFSMNYLSQPGDIAGNNLYNGNISNSTVALSKFRNGDPVGYTYHYDLLNRLKTMRYHPLSAATATWDINTRDPNDTYAENITYDGNGNILSYLRNGANSTNMPLAMDNLVYRYSKQIDPVNSQEYLLHNQLQQVQEQNAAVDANYSQTLNGIEDIDNQTSNVNYQYDKIGNLVFDNASNITDITWTVYGKIKSITKTEANRTTTITYSYDITGNRVKKLVTVNQGGNITATTTWYSRDAQGNSLAIYSDKQDNQTGIWWKEQHLYGSNRLGMWTPGIDINVNNGTNEWGITGKKTYELSNHLGNIFATISDKIIAVPSSGNSAVVDHYEADIMSMQDYYTSGMVMPARKWSLNAYRYGFNGKEVDNELKGDDNSLDFGDRFYDPRITRLLSVDHKSGAYPSHSPYSYAVGNPVFYIDPDGNSVEPSNISVSKQRGTNHFTVSGDITVKIQLINLSAKSNKDLYIYDYISKVKSGLSDILSTKATTNVTTDIDIKVGDKGTASNKLVSTGKMRETQWTYALNVKVEIEVIDSKDQIRNDAHVLAIVDGYDPSPAPDIEGHPMKTWSGMSNSDRIATVSVDDIANFKVDPALHTALHELGHSLGVPHFWTKVPGDKGTPNLMDYKYINNSLTDEQLIQNVWFNNLLTPNTLLNKINDGKTPWSQEKEKFKTSSKDALNELLKHGIHTSK